MTCSTEMVAVVCPDCNGTGLSDRLIFDRKEPVFQGGFHVADRMLMKHPPCHRCDKGKRMLPRWMAP